MSWRTWLVLDLSSSLPFQRDCVCCNDGAVRRAKPYFYRKTRVDVRYCFKYKLAAWCAEESLVHLCWEIGV